MTPKPDLTEFIVNETKLMKWAEGLDNSRLIWEFFTKVSEIIPLVGPQAAIIEQMIIRICPEWETEGMDYHNWGWFAADHPIIYDQDKYEAWCALPEELRS